MTSVGTLLRSHREAQGRPVADIAQELCITQAYLRAIEADDLRNLPGTFFYRSFVRQYAELLGLKAQEWRPHLEAMKLPWDEEPPPASAGAAAVEQTPARWRRVIRVPDPILEAANRLDLSRRKVALPVFGFLAALVACSSFYAWWSRNGFAIPQPGMVTEAQPPSHELPQVDVTTSTGEDGLQHVALNLSATEETWVSITSGGKQIFSGLLEPSETKTLTGLEQARVKVGNAGGVDVRWKGQPIGPIGKSGQVRTVVLRPDGFEILPAASPRQEEAARESL
jgi:hypothetical protein